MEIIVGRGGNQLNKITDPKIGACHCRITEKEDMYMVDIANYRPTFINGERVLEFNNLFPQDSIISMGDTINCPISELMIPYDYSCLTDWGLAAERFERVIDVDVFLNCCIAPDDRNSVAEYNIKACKAFLLIKEGRLRAAQEIIYEVGDALYALQDGSVELKTAYTAVMALCALLYEKAGLTSLQNTAKERTDILINSGGKPSPAVYSNCRMSQPF